ncbi:MAG: hypothetical protein ABJJ43_12195, partial [Ekhidna sp.]
EDRILPRKNRQNETKQLDVEKSKSKSKSKRSKIEKGKRDKKVQLIEARKQESKKENTQGNAQILADCTGSQAIYARGV